MLRDEIFVPVFRLLHIHHAGLRDFGNGGHIESVDHSSAETRRREGRTRKGEEEGDTDMDGGDDGGGSNSKASSKVTEGGARAGVTRKSKEESGGDGEAVRAMAK